MWADIASVPSGRLVTLEPLTPAHLDGLRHAAGGRAHLALHGHDRRRALARRRGRREPKYLLLRHAFETLGCRRVEFKTDARNERARAALAALPADFEGIHRKHMLVRGGERRDSAWYAVIDDDWPDVKTALERRLAAKL